MSMSSEERIAWIDGKIVPAEEARVSVLDHGFLYGDGVFEGIRVTPVAIFRFEDHMKRLETASRAVGIEIADCLARYRTDVTYPETEFGQSLRTIAALIGQGLTTRVYYAAQGIARFGGYDTHAEQKPRHDQLVDELSQSVRAFYKDLKLG